MFAVAGDQDDSASRTPSRASRRAVERTATSRTSMPLTRSQDQKRPPWSDPRASTPSPRSAVRRAPLPVGSARYAYTQSSVIQNRPTIHARLPQR
ncbi:hypothetical protein LV779_21190 [Streptomyces thinghirensis]|nr:hypothetical protein [Streptomyces thinghirensis]